MSEFEAEFSNYFNYFTEVEEHFQRVAWHSTVLDVPAGLGVD